ncbi:MULTISPECIES: glycogen/starch synthase [unclassified Lentimicrobium]|uniref:glycogen/starch synthase n=1 Tax=unclassified Lentimicrobium TaxID=2677434 RepID=UPI0015534A68|nr:MULTISPECIES: glycogen/starch synthase [unclassified Lentimicrobium]NPD47942.1 glycogen/starch synthase [Lentimicrobium sp. S6]NPD86759.1 glycogen/starch synthase [Lentimicrobium sp. L6]
MKKRVLFVNQEIMPYLPETNRSKIGRYLPQGIQEKGKEIRTFMPRFGNINERRNQLHEVIRLSGMNLIIDDHDHPLIIKVASIQQARMQVYFIDNEEYFQRKFTTVDKNGKFFEDNDERTVFFSRGVLETVKKLGWAPDIVHCHGWMSALVPLYIKKAFKDNPLFNDTKIIVSLYNDHFDAQLNDNLPQKIKMEGIDDTDLDIYKGGNYMDLMFGALQYADAIIYGAEELSADYVKMAEETGKPILTYQPEEDYVNAYNTFYDSLLED